MRAAVALTLATLALAGCGGGSPAPAVRADWHRAADAMAHGDGATACAYFDPAVTRVLVSSSGTSCQAAVRDLAAPLSSAERAGVAAARVTSVHVDGARATIVYDLTPGLRKLGFRGRSRLVRGGRRWLIAPRG